MMGWRRVGGEGGEGYWSARLDPIFHVTPFFMTPFFKARIRARVEHAFHVLKNLFHYKKVRYKGLAKNTAQLHTLFGLVNLMLAKRRLLALHAQGAS